jgi:Ca2+-binding EF-hand superfamily protein
MSLRTQSIALALALASGGFAMGTPADAQQPGGRIYPDRRGDTYPDQRGQRFDDWTPQAFRELDRDGNGRITAAEWSYDREDFRRADHNRDGVLTQREFLGEADDDTIADVADDRGDVSSADETRFVALDRNRDGRVSRNEWGRDRASFDRLDENRDGYLTRAEMASPDDSVDDFATLDSDRNGVISRGEWLQSAASFERLDTNRDGRLTASEYNGRGNGGTVSTVPSAQNAAYRAGYERGMTEGRAAGREDKTRNGGWDLEGQRELEQADSGYRDSLGARADYQSGYRTAFRIGYREGFGPR